MFYILGKKDFQKRSINLVMTNYSDANKRVKTD